MYANLRKYENLHVIILRVAMRSFRIPSCLRIWLVFMDLSSEILVILLYLSRALQALTRHTSFGFAHEIRIARSIETKLGAHNKISPTIAIYKTRVC